MIAMRRLIIFVAQLLALVFIVVSTLAGAVLGEWLFTSMPILGNAIVALTNSSGLSFFGAIVGFFISTLLAAVFFVLVEIANNTRNPFNP